MEVGETVSIKDIVYEAIATTPESKWNYPCNDCVGFGNTPLCRVLPECSQPYIHFVKVKPNMASL